MACLHSKFCCDYGHVELQAKNENHSESQKKTSLDNNDRREGKNVQQWMRDKIYCFTTPGAIHSATFCLGQMRGSAFYVSTSKPLFRQK